MPLTKVKRLIRNYSRRIATLRKWLIRASSEPLSERVETFRNNVTEHPSAAGTSQQIVEAFANQNPPRYLLRDRDRIYGNEVRLRIASLEMEQVLTAPRSPWQNPYAERLIGSIRRDCLDHFVILNARHLTRTLSSYFAYYHDQGLI